MSGFFGIGGTNSRQQNESIGNLNNLFNYGLDSAKRGSALGTANQSAGVSALGTAQGYWQKLMSGNRPALEQAVAPETNAVQSQGDAARRNAATTGTARGGGTAGANEQQKTSLMSQIDNLLFGVRPAAAKEGAAVGGKIADVGTAQMGLANQQLEIAGTSTAAGGRIATDARKQHDMEVQQTIKDIFGWGGTGAQ